uniref:Uncharacterized protein n=1 Tax=Arundo donax TaxID=35708 RepID=A0A0A9AVJ7_ARUDO
MAGLIVFRFHFHCMFAATFVAISTWVENPHLLLPAHEHFYKSNS